MNFKKLCGILECIAHWDGINGLLECFFKYYDKKAWYEEDFRTSDVIELVRDYADDEADINGLLGFDISLTFDEFGKATVTAC